MEAKLIELTDKQLEQYIQCPNLFYIRNVAGILSKSRVTIRSIAEKHKDRMFYTLMDGKIPDIDTVLIEFSKDCMEYKYPVTHRDVQKASNQLVVLFNWLVGNRVQIGDIGTPFEVTFPKANVIIKGNFGALRYINDKLELLAVDFSAKDPSQDLVDISIRYTMQAYAVHKLVPKYDLSCVRALTVRYNRVQELFSYRDRRNFERLEHTIENVANALRNNIFYPRETFECMRCPVRAYCAGITDYVQLGVNDAD